MAAVGVKGIRWERCPFHVLIVRPFRYFRALKTTEQVTKSCVIIMNRSTPSVLTLLVSCWWTQVCNEMSW